jgi:hypothetical protein
MKVSDEAENLIFSINESSDKAIKNIYEVSVLIEIAISGKKKEFEYLIFNAKYIKGLSSVLSNRNITGDKYIEKMYDEFNNKLQEFFESLKSIVSSWDKSAIVNFNNKYFQMNQESILNVISLIEDLSLCKEYLNRNPGSLH